MQRESIRFLQSYPTLTCERACSGNEIALQVVALRIVAKYCPLGHCTKSFSAFDVIMKKVYVTRRIPNLEPNENLSCNMFRGSLDATGLTEQD